MHAIGISIQRRGQGGGLAPQARELGPTKKIVHPSPPESIIFLTIHAITCYSIHPCFLVFPEVNACIYL